jgi:molybdopterin converting factor subunit 1
VTITVLYFAALREIAGHGETTLRVPEGIVTVGDLADHLEKTVPGLDGRLRTIRWAKNEEFVDLRAVLDEGDVIALIPPVAGGSR